MTYRPLIQLHNGSFIAAHRIVMIYPRDCRVTVSTDIGTPGREQYFWLDFASPDQAQDYADELQSQINAAMGVDDNG
jgi:hypothetical protein